MSKELARNEIDERTRAQVIRFLGTKTIRQIAERLSISPETVLAVKQDIVDSMDALTVEEHVAKAFVDLQNVTALAMAEFQSTDDARSKAPLLATAVGATKTTMQMLEKWEAKNKVQVDTLNRKRQTELTTALNRMSELTSTELDDGLPHTKDEILQSMLNNLMTAAVEMDLRNESQ